MINTSSLILKNYIENQKYGKKVSNHLKPTYFEETIDQDIFKFSLNFFKKYNKSITYDILSLIVNEKLNISDENKDNYNKRLKDLKEYENNIDVEWLIDETEKWVKERSVFLGMVKCVDIFENKPNELNQIIDIMSNALSISFDTEIGHDYVRDMVKRFEHYTSPQKRIPTHLDGINKMLNGGLAKKSTFIFMGSPGIGKTRLMVDLGANLLKSNYNVLYITLELSELYLNERFDANLLDININDLYEIEQDFFYNRVNELKKKTNGRLITKEYSPNAITAKHIELLIDELEEKENFKPDCVIVDYLNVMLPFKDSKQNSNYKQLKVVTDELSGLAKTKDVILLTATHTNKDGWGGVEPELKMISESYGIGSSADVIIALYGNQDQISNNSFNAKKLKSRLSDLTQNQYCSIGFDNSRMSSFDIESPIFPTEQIVDDKPKKNTFNLNFD